MELADMRTLTQAEVAEASRPNRLFKEDVRQDREAAGRPRIHNFKATTVTNWMTPLLWIQIERAAKRAGHSMRPQEIVHELRKTDNIVFARIAPQTVGAWIDRTGPSPRWSDKTLKRVQQGNKPGGLTTRVGALVRSDINL